MISIFLGLTAANLLLMGIVFVMGWIATDATGQPTTLFPLHVSLGIAGGLMTCLTHLAVYTYFMASSKWLHAATIKSNIDTDRYVSPSLTRKRRVLPVVMAPILVTMMTLFAGAAADSTVNPWWPGEVHLIVAVVAIAVNLVSAGVEFRYLVAQRQTMDEVLTLVNSLPSTTG